MFFGKGGARSMLGAGHGRVKRPGWRGRLAYNGEHNVWRQIRPGGLAGEPMMKQSALAVVLVGAAMTLLTPCPARAQDAAAKKAAAKSAPKPAGKPDPGVMQSRAFDYR